MIMIVHLNDFYFLNLPFDLHLTLSVFISFRYPPPPLPSQQLPPIQTVLQPATTDTQWLPLQTSSPVFNLQPSSVFTSQSTLPVFTTLHTAIPSVPLLVQTTPTTTTVSASSPSCSSISGSSSAWIKCKVGSHKVIPFHYIFIQQRTM